MLPCPPLSLFTFTVTVERKTYTGNGVVKTVVAENVPATITLRYRRQQGTDGETSYKTVETLIRPPYGIRILEGDVLTFPYPYDDPAVTVQEVTEYRTQTGRVSHFKAVCW